MNRASRSKARMALVLAVAAILAETPSLRAQATSASDSSPSSSARVDPDLVAAMESRGAARAILRLRENAAITGAEGGASFGGRFSAAAALAEGALNAGTGGGATRLGPLGGDLRVVELTAAQLRRLLDSGAVAEITLDRLAAPGFDRRTPQAAPPAPEPSPEPSSSLGQAARRGTGGELLDGIFPGLGRALDAAEDEILAPVQGPAAAILDTGVAADHPYLRGAVVRQACFSSNVAADRAKSLCPNGRAAQTLGEAARPCDPAEMGPLCAHGGKVAGLISGRGGRFQESDGTIRPLEGEAPGAPLVAIQIFSRIEDPAICRAFGEAAPCPLSYVSDQIAALRFVSATAAEYDVAVVNLSLASAAPGDPCDDSLEGRQYLAEISYLIDRMGVATVAATGNGGRLGRVGMPACVSRALAVAAADASGAAPTSFSNLSASVDLLAPGVGLVSATLGETPYGADEGTSFAASLATGAILRLKRAAPGADAGSLAALLVETGREVEGPAESGLKLRVMDLEAALGRLRVAQAQTGAGSGLASAASSSGGSAPLPPRLAPPEAPTALPPEILDRLRAEAKPARPSSVLRRLPTEVLLGAAPAPAPPLKRPIAPPPPTYAPLPPPPPVPAAPMASEAAVSPIGARFLFELDPAILDAALAGEAPTPEARAEAARRLILQAAPPESPLAALQLDSTGLRGSASFESRLDSRQTQALEEGFPGRLAPDRLSAP